MDIRNERIKSIEILLFKYMFIFMYVNHILFTVFLNISTLFY